MRHKTTHSGSSIYRKVSFKVLDVSELESHGNIEGTDRGLLLSTKNIIDLNNHSTFRTEYLKRSSKSLIQQKSQVSQVSQTSQSSQAQNVEKNLNSWKLDQKWLKICNEVALPSVNNLFLVNHDMENSRKVKFAEEKIYRTEMPEAETMFRLFRVNENGEQLKEILKAGGISPRRYQKDKPQLPCGHETVPLKEFSTSAERKRQIKRTIVSVIPSQRQRRKSCQCTWCGGISAVEKKLDRKTWIDLSSAPEKKKQKSQSPSSSSPTAQRKSRQNDHSGSTSPKKKKSRGGVLSRDESKSGTFAKENISSEMEIPNLSVHGEDKTPERTRSIKSTQKNSSLTTPHAKRSSRIIYKLPSEITSISAVVTSKNRPPSKQGSFSNIVAMLRDKTKKLSESLQNRRISQGDSIVEIVSLKPDERKDTELRTATVETEGMNTILNEPSGNVARPDLADFIITETPKARKTTNSKSLERRIAQRIVIGKRTSQERSKPKQNSIERLAEKRTEDSQPDQEGESSIRVKESLKRIVSEKSLTHHSKISSVYGNTSDYALFKASRNNVCRLRSPLISQLTGESTGVSAIKDEKRSVPKDSSQSFSMIRNALGVSHAIYTNASNKGYDIPSRKARHKISTLRTEDISDEVDSSVEGRYFLPAVEEKKEGIKPSSNSSSFTKTPKPLFTASTKALMNIIPSSAKSPTDFIAAFYKKNHKKKL